MTTSAISSALIRPMAIFTSMAATLVISLSGAASATTDGPAELPRMYVNSSMASTPAPGAKTVVPAGANLQLALNDAHCGDTLLLQAGATFTGDL